MGWWAQREAGESQPRLEGEARLSRGEERGHGPGSILGRTQYPREKWDTKQPCQRAPDPKQLRSREVQMEFSLHTLLGTQ